MCYIIIMDKDILRELKVINLQLNKLVVQKSSLLLDTRLKKFYQIIDEEMNED